MVVENHEYEDAPQLVRTALGQGTSLFQQQRNPGSALQGVAGKALHPAGEVGRSWGAEDLIHLLILVQSAFFSANS